MYVCVECGKVGYEMVQQWVDNIWLNRKTSVYTRSRHIRATVEQYAHPQHRSSIVSDFIGVVDIITKHEMIKKNISRYDYYIIRLASRKGVKLVKKNPMIYHTVKQKKKRLMTGYSVPSTHY